MNKLVSILLSLSVIASTFAAPTIVVAEEQGTHSDGIPGMWEAEHPRRHRWIYENNQSFNDDGYGDRQPFYRHHREYRGNDDGAFIAGGAALLGLALILGSQPRYTAPRQRYQYDHVQYCMNRYRSYRAWDNTYQPNYGPRRICR